jgi:hypothetical protein
MQTTNFKMDDYSDRFNVSSLLIDMVTILWINIKPITIVIHNDN